MREITELEKLALNEITIDEFGEKYEKLLKRFSTNKKILLKMREVLHRQTLFLVGQWLEEKRKIKQWEQKQNRMMQ